MKRSFTLQFLARAINDFERSSINDEALQQLRGYRAAVEPIYATREERRLAWACGASVLALSPDLSKLSPLEHTWHIDLDVFCAEAPKLLAPLRKALVVNITEAEMVDARGADRLAARGKERELRQLRRVETLLVAAKVRNYVIAGDAFYDVVYAFCQDAEKLPAWAARLMEIQ